MQKAESYYANTPFAFVAVEHVQVGCASTLTGYVQEKGKVHSLYASPIYTSKNIRPSAQLHPFLHPANMKFLVRTYYNVLTSKFKSILVSLRFSLFF